VSLSLWRTLRLLIWFSGLLCGSGVLIAQGGYVRLAFTPSSFPDVALQDAQGALRVWGDELARHVQGLEGASTTIYPSLEAFAAATREGGVDLAVLSTLEFFRTERALGMELGFASSDGVLGTKRYLLVGRLELAGKPLKDLKGLRFSYNRFEPMGMLFANHALLQEGLPEMDRFFRAPESNRKGSQAIHSVFFGRVDVCVVSEDSFRTTVTMNPQVGKKLCVLRTSPPLNTGVVIYRRGFPQATRRLLQDAIIHLKSYPRGEQLLSLFQTTDVRPLTEASLTESRRMYREYLLKKGRLL